MNASCKKDLLAGSSKIGGIGGFGFGNPIRLKKWPCCSSWYYAPRLTQSSKGSSLDQLEYDGHCLRRAISGHPPALPVASSGIVDKNGGDHEHPCSANPIKSNGFSQTIATRRNDRL